MTMKEERTPLDNGMKFYGKKKIGGHPRLLIVYC